jgi:tetratricopeptide (TPR) repeat protein
MQYAQEVIVKGTNPLERGPHEDPVAQPSPVVFGHDSVTPWMKAVQAMQEDQQASVPSVSVSTSLSKSLEKTHSVSRDTATGQDMHKREASDSEDDLDTDFAKAALSTGSKAFDCGEWEEADSLLQEAVRILQRLSKRQRAFCDGFNLYYNLAVCAYHIHEPEDAGKALNGFVDQPAHSDNQRECIHNATHLLSQLYVRMNHLDRARIECEKALQARRRPLGKQHVSSLESLALMAHIYVLLNNRALAKSCLAMIPEANREGVLRTVEESLGTSVKHLDFPSLLTRARPSETDITVERARRRLSTVTLEAPLDPSSSDSTSMMTRSPTAKPWQAPRSIASESTTLVDSSPFMKNPHLSASSRAEWRPSEDGSRAQEYSPGPKKADLAIASSCESERVETPKGKPLSRKEILSRVGCQPRDKTEEAVCDGDHGALLVILNKKKGFWRSSLRKRGRPERVTALHFAALLGEVDMARALIQAGFSVNEVPFGYSTTLTPLNFAIGARQVAMVDLLTANGAVPAEPDTWSTLAGQLMSRSWLMKTMSDADKNLVPNQIIAIMDILLNRGWDINTPMATSGGTVLHQAVSFWTGAYKWDLKLRAIVTSFLCERGANPFQTNAQGKTPYDVAAGSEHQDLLVIIEEQVRRRKLIGTPAMPVELPSHAQ